MSIMQSPPVCTRTPASTHRKFVSLSQGPCYIDHRHKSHFRSIRMSADRQLSNLLVIGVPLSAKAHERLSEHFSTITHIPNNSAPVSEQLYAEADVIYGFPVNKIPAVAQVPKLKFVQLTSAGSELILASHFAKDPESKRVPILSASGVHTTAIPQVSTALEITVICV